jgi:hydroxymethylglutaryl-CoA reductase (NADPH)
MKPDIHHPSFPVPEEGLPVNRRNNYSRDIARARLHFLEEHAGCGLPWLASSEIDPGLTRCNIEKIIGFAQTPVGIAGPLLVNGKHAKGDFYIPMSTTEGALLMSYQRGIRLITLSGGANTIVVKNSIQRAPVFLLEDIMAAGDFISWCHLHLPELKVVAGSTTRHGRLLGFHSFIFGNAVVLRFEFTTGDAMGMNMITKSVKAICEYISGHYPVIRYLLESNMAVDKKPGFINMIMGRGKTVTAEAVISNNLVTKYLKTSAEKIVEAYSIQMLGNTNAGVMGCNYHVANGLAAIFLACGQDMANIAESSNGITSFRMKGNDLYVSVTLPSLVVGTIGGGTSLPTQRECLGIMGCYGRARVLKFTEIIAATILAGEISLAGSIAANDFMEAHEKYGRNGHKI